MTRASFYAIGAALSKERRPITMISRTLSATEANYATNERELLAIIWALQNLRHYLYGIQELNIFAFSERNSILRIRRWIAFIEEFSPTFYYNPGKDNVAADGPSRQFFNTYLAPTFSTQACASGVSLTEVSPMVENPINCFKNQFLHPNAAKKLKSFSETVNFIASHS